MIKKILWLCWLALLAWFFQPVLEVIFPVPTESMVDGFLDLSLDRDRDILLLLRFMVWMLLIYILIKLTRPFLEFALPTAKRYAVTKPFRRIQGVFTEFGLLGVFFMFASLVVLMPFGMKKTYEGELDVQLESIGEKINETISMRNSAEENLRKVAIEGNEWLIGQKNYFNKFFPNTNPYTVRRDDYFRMPYQTTKEKTVKHNYSSKPSTTKSTSKYNWHIKPQSPPKAENNADSIFMTLYYYPTRKDPHFNFQNRVTTFQNRFSTTFGSSLFTSEEEENKSSVLKVIEDSEGKAWSNLRTTYNSYKKKYSEALQLYTNYADEVMAINDLPSEKVIGRDFFMEVDLKHPAISEKAKNQVWASFKNKPFTFIYPAFKSYWGFALVIAFVIYGLSHTSVRYKVAPLYEGVLRFFEQGRFGLGGSSRFAGIIEEWATLYKNQKEGIFLGRSLFNPFLNIGIEDKRHMLTVAATRAGKGTTAIIPNLLLWQGSTIVIDPKGTNAIVTARRRREMGQSVYIVDPFNIVGEEETAKFNPLANLDPDSETIREDISVIAEALVVPDPEQKERHWDDGARTVISGLIAHLVTSGKYENPELSMIRDMLGLTPKEQEDLWLDMIMNKKAGGLAKDAGSRVMRGVTTNEINSIISNADKHTEWLSAPTMKNALSKSTFEFSEMKEKPTTIYLVLPPNKLVTYNRFLRLFINQALSEISAGGRSKIPVLMIMDEFLALGRMEEVEKAFGLLAGYNLVMWPIVQEIGKLKDIYGSSFNSFINNSRAVQVFGVQGETAEFVSNYLGERRTSSMTKKDSWERAAKLRAPNEVTIDVSVESYWQYVLRAGKAPLVLERVPYYKHSMFEEMYDQDPDYA